MLLTAWTAKLPYAANTCSLCPLLATIITNIYIDSLELYVDGKTLHVLNQRHNSRRPSRNGNVHCHNFTPHPSAPIFTVWTSQFCQYCHSQWWTPPPTWPVDKVKYLGTSYGPLQLLPKSQKVVARREGRESAQSTGDVCKHQHHHRLWMKVTPWCSLGFRIICTDLHARQVWWVHWWYSTAIWDCQIQPQAAYAAFTHGLANT